MKKFTAALIFLFIVKFATAQLAVGAAFGTFNVPGSIQRFKGHGPTVRLEYTGDEETQQLYLDASLYRKDLDGYSTEVFSDEGATLGNASTTVAYNIKHIQLGFKRSLAGDFTDTKFNCFLGAGGAVSFIQRNYKYVLTGYEVPNEKVNRTLYGFHFNTGGQWRIKPVVVELRGDLSLMIKPIVTGSESSYILTSLRLGIIVPVTKY